MLEKKNTLPARLITKIVLIAAVIFLFPHFDIGGQNRKTWGRLLYF